MSLKGGSLAVTFGRIFGKKTLEMVNEFEFKDQSGLLNFSGLCSKAHQGLKSKSLQYIYINGRSVSSTPLHKAVNDHFKASMAASYMEVASDHAGNVRPIFVLNLCCPFSDYDITFESTKCQVEFKDWQPVIYFLHLCLSQFWKAPLGGPSSGAVLHTVDTFCQLSKQRRPGNSKTETSHGSLGLESLPAMPANRKRQKRVNESLYGDIKRSNNGYSWPKRDISLSGSQRRDRENKFKGKNESIWDEIEQKGFAPRRCFSSPPFVKIRSKIINGLWRKSVAMEVSLPPANISKAFDIAPREFAINDMSKLPCERKKSVPQVDVSKISDVGNEYNKWIEGQKKAMAGPSEPKILSLDDLKGRHEGLVPSSLARAQFCSPRVLNQVDTKFIATKVENMLVIVDQHAADERVVLEDLRAQILNPGYNHTSTLLDTPIEAEISMAEEHALLMYGPKIERWGWGWRSHPPAQILKEDIDDFRRETIELIAVPSVLGVKLMAADLHEFLGKLLETNGCSDIPPSLIRLLNSKACRGAIMFGDFLDRDESQLLLDTLKETELCFQCAHGRPTMVPMVDLKTLHKVIDTLEA